MMAYDAETGSEEEALRSAQELAEKAQAVFELQSDELTKQEAALNEAIKALGKQRQLLGNHPPKRHGDHGLTQAEQESLKELQLNLTEVFEAIDLQSVELERIGNEIDVQEEEIFIRLEDLRTTKGKLSKIYTYSPKHEVRELGDGRFAITVGFPGVELEPAQIAVELSGVVNHKVDVSSAMFFVEKVSEHTNELTTHLDHLKGVLGSHINNHDMESHSLRQHVPSADAVRFGLAQSAFFVGNDANLEITTESNGDRLVVTVLKDGESVHEIRSNELGEGMVWFGIPQIEDIRELDELHKIHLSTLDSIPGIQSLDNISLVV
ncbi:MAG: hypothetical protein N2C12_02415, partial [Planctomycetales bacterium]